MARLALFFFALSGALYYLVQVDRRSPLALTVVEHNDVLPLPLAALAGLLGVACAGLALARRFASLPQADGASTPARPPGPGPGRGRKVGAPAGFRDRVTGQAAALNLPPGARLVLDPAVGVPLRLVLEQVPEGRAKRALGTLGRFLASLPTPPRVQVQFVDCPAGQQPLHVLVKGSLATALPRGSFKVVSTLDRIDVLFSAHDPVWREQW